MNSKERVTKTFKKEQIDYVPMNYLTNLAIDRRLKEHFNLDINDNEGLLQKLHIDFRNTYYTYKGPRLHPEKEGILVDPAWGIEMKWVKNEFGGYCDYCNFPLKNATLEYVKNWKCPNPDHYDYEGLLNECKKHKDYYVTFNNQVDIINGTGFIMGMENTLAGLALNEEPVLYYIDKHSEIQYEILKKALETAGEYIDAVWMGEDLGTQRGPIISPHMFKKHILPKHKKAAELIKSYNKTIIFHSCGSSSWAFNDLADIGVDVMDTLQPEAKDMEPEYLLKTYGNKLCFHGMISTAGALATGSKEDIRQTVINTLDIMAGNGYALAPTHQIQDNTPVENVITMYDTCKNYIILNG